MAGETPITIVGNLTADPELRTTGNGGTVVNFTIASTPRTYSPMATNISQSLSKGMRVIAQGNLTQRSYQTQSGESRTVVELRVNEIGPALSRNTAQVQRNASSSGFSGGSSNSGGFSGGNRGGYQGGATQANASNANSGDFSGNGGGFASQGGDPWANSSDTDSFNSGAAFGSGNDFGSNDEFADPEF